VLSPNWKTPDRPKIRYILSLLNAQDQQPKVSPTNEGDFVLKFMLMRDTDVFDIICHLREALDFIKSSLANNDGGVLVHCHKGMSRSGAVVVAFAMEEMQLDYETALRFVRRGRDKVDPNNGFMKQLRLWHQLNYNIKEAADNAKEEYAAWKIGNDAELKWLQENGLDLAP
jgi:predicted protein tyrosine phosphatase